MHCQCRWPQQSFSLHRQIILQLCLKRVSQNKKTSFTCRLKQQTNFFISKVANFNTVNPMLRLSSLPMRVCTLLKKNWVFGECFCYTAIIVNCFEYFLHVITTVPVVCGRKRHTRNRWHSIPDKKVVCTRFSRKETRACQMTVIV